jgi:hypothetical protein
MMSFRPEKYYGKSLQQHGPALYLPELGGFDVTSAELVNTKQFEAVYGVRRGWSRQIIHWDEVGRQAGRIPQAPCPHPALAFIEAVGYVDLDDRSATLGHAPQMSVQLEAVSKYLERGAEVVDMLDYEMSHAIRRTRERAADSGDVSVGQYVPPVFYTLATWAVSKAQHSI